MNEQSFEEGSGSTLKTAAMVGAVVALLAANVYLYLQLQQVKADTARLRESLSTEIANLRDSSNAVTATNRRTIDSLKDELETARKQASSAASHAKTEALARVETLQKQLSEEQARQRQQAQQVQSEIGQVKEQATAAHSKIAETNTEVGTVKTQVASTRSELEQTIANLKKVNGELSQHASYIATNSKELTALRRLGERNYIEFNLAKSKQPQRVGDVTLLLKKTDLKRNKYSVEVFADDKRTEKKDRNVNEPVQFYVSKAKQPYELVVNEVKKDLIVGYLATPKDLMAR